MNESKEDIDKTLEKIYNNIINYNFINPDDLSFIIKNENINHDTKIHYLNRIFKLLDKHKNL